MVGRQKLAIICSSVELSKPDHGPFGAHDNSPTRLHVPEHGAVCHEASLGATDGYVCLSLNKCWSQFIVGPSSVPAT